MYVIKILCLYVCYLIFFSKKKRKNVYGKDTVFLIDIVVIFYYKNILLILPKKILIKQKKNYLDQYLRQITTNTQRSKQYRIILLTLIIRKTYFPKIYIFVDAAFHLEGQYIKIKCFYACIKIRVVKLKTRYRMK